MCSMYTVITLENGILTVAADTHGEWVEERLWRAAIEPAIRMLCCCIGDGSLYIPHRPGELA
jgi:hypothetical protein